MELLTESLEQKGYSSLNVLRRVHEWKARKQVGNIFDRIFTKQFEDCYLPDGVSCVMLFRVDGQRPVMRVNADDSILEVTQGFDGNRVIINAHNLDLVTGEARPETESVYPHDSNPIAIDTVLESAKYAEALLSKYTSNGRIPGTLDI